MTREKRESGHRPSGYPHFQTENTHKIANGKADINCGHQAAITRITVTVHLTG
jgi:hypothetical protein